MFCKTKELKREIEYLQSRMDELYSRNWHLEQRVNNLMNYLGVEEVKTPPETKIVKNKPEKEK